MEKLISLVEKRLENILSSNDKLSVGTSSNEMTSLMNCLMNLNQMSNQSKEIAIRADQLKVQAKAFEMELSKNKK